MTKHKGKSALHAGPRSNDWWANNHLANNWWPTNQPYDFTLEDLGKLADSESIIVWSLMNPIDIGDNLQSRLLYRILYGTT
jgi:hypothetical protein